MMSHPNAVQRAQTRELVFAPGEPERVLEALGFSPERLKDNNYFVKAVEAIGDTDELERMIMTHRYLTSLARSQLGAELMVRLSLEDWAKARPRLRFMEMSDIASMVINAEAKNRYGHLPAELCGMT